NNHDKSNLNVLPLAKPVNKAKKISVVETETKIDETKNNKIFPTQAPEVTPEQNTVSADSSPAIKHKIIKLNKKTILYTSISAGFLFIIYAVYLLNSQNHKLDSQPLLTSERKLIDTNEQKNNAGLSSTQTAILGKTLPVSAANVPQTIQAPVVVARSAKVDILARVKIQIVADGKEVFSGYRQPGPLEFSFKDKAEILVYDASKVKLTYESWDHGELGWNERKRKITLNAKPYEE
ncbi:MAG: hypothetical protein V4591_03390, partial [Bdellovibrionota bacterium]